MNNILLYFYVKSIKRQKSISDTLGHLASESVTIKKVSPAIGLDYVTTSILILAISGVAIIAIIIEMRSKKRIIHY